jgi:fatty-acyl-CoA synthase
VSVLNSQMQDDCPLTVTHLRRRMDHVNRAAQVLTLRDDGSVEAMGHPEIAARVDRLAHALDSLGIQQGDRVATFAWNNRRHFELYMAIPCVGAVLHTINVRLFAEQVEYIINHAEDRVIFVDDSLVGVLEPMAAELGRVEHFVVMGGGDIGGLPRAVRYEDLLAAAPGTAYDYPDLDERQAAALCYTSGTTGNPKGVLYSHRSVSLHSSATLMTDAVGLSRHDRVLAVVPMFHANAWGLPHGTVLAGADLVLPDRHLQAEPLSKLIADVRPTVLGCVPTIFADLLRYADAHEDVDLSSLNKCACGGSAVPKALMRDFQQRHEVTIYQAWGMTESSPLGTYSRPDGSPDDDAYWERRAMQGRPLPWIELRLIDDDGQQVPWDGSSTGELEMRGPWVAAGYYREGASEEKFDEGWLRTGDIASIDDEAAVQITDRAKDVIKSGGEWISSVDLENELMAHPDVVEAAVIAKPDPRWAERPLACVVLRDGAEPDADGLVEHLGERVARFWLPDEFAFIGEVPKTSVGKFDKKVLRAQLADGTLAGRVSVARR